mmetsp:Transcript_1774/g.4174  ORF Transcript_1774/g.4174 Transcript_1774/m.4174 type:complete len:244 (+) Transcript_1774:1-732(+)
MLGLTSAVSLVEAANSILRDMLAALRPDHLANRILLSKLWVLPLVTCTFLFMFGVTMCRRSSSEAVDLVDYYISNFLLTLVGIAEFFVVGWVFGVRDFSTLMQHRLEWGVSPVLAACWRFFGPGILTVILLTGLVGAIRSPLVPETWAQAIGWTIGVGPLLVFLFIYFQYPKWYPSHQRPKRRLPLIEKLGEKASHAWQKATGRPPADVAERNLLKRDTTDPAHYTEREHLESPSRPSQVASV